MKIDASRYRQFLTNPDEYRIRELWNLVPETSNSGVHALATFGRRRGSAFHDMLDGERDIKALSDKYGETATQVASEMFDANEAYSARLLDEVVWREKEFCKRIPAAGSGNQHLIVGRIDTKMRRYGEEFILDYKTTKARTKADMVHYRAVLSQSPQVDFYLIASGLRRFVFRILWRNAKKVVQVSELEVTRAQWELDAFQRGVAMVCDTVESWQEKYGIQWPWPRAISLPTNPDNYQYRPLYQRAIYEGMQNCVEGFKTRVEHLALDVEDEEEDESQS